MRPAISIFVYCSTVVLLLGGSCYQATGQDGTAAEAPDSQVQILNQELGALIDVRPIRDVYLSRSVSISVRSENYFAGSTLLADLSIEQVRDHLDLSKPQIRALDALIKRDADGRMSEIRDQMRKSEGRLRERLDDVSRLTTSMEQQIGEEVREILLHPQWTVLQQLRQRRTLLLLGWANAIKLALQEHDLPLDAQSQVRLDEVLVNRWQEIAATKRSTIQEVNRQAIELLPAGTREQIAALKLNLDVPYPYPLEFWVAAIDTADLGTVGRESRLAPERFSWQYNRIGQVEVSLSAPLIAERFISLVQQTDELQLSEAQIQEFWSKHSDPQSTMGMARKNFQDRLTDDLNRYLDEALSYEEYVDGVRKAGVELDDQVFDEFYSELLPFQQAIVDRYIVQCDIISRSLLGSLCDGELGKQLELDNETREKLHGLREKALPELRKLIRQLDLDTRRRVLAVLDREQRRVVEQTFHMNEVDADLVHHPEMMFLPRDINLTPK